jgi:hydrogenase maturation protease
MSVLVAGIGNIFLGDDAFGVEVVRRLADRPLPDGVRVIDFGIRGFDLAHALMDSTDSTAVLVDATARGGEPGTLYLLEASIDDGRPALETHAMDPATVLRLIQTLGGRPPRVLVVGCEPSSVELDEDGEFGLSPPVEAAVDEAVRMVEALVADLLQNRESSRDPSLHSGPSSVKGAPA